MFYVPLHHKYRPQTFAQLVGQEAISTTLTNAIVNRKIAPAYLFTGPRGTGKTSSARILAKSLNCLKSDVPTPDPCGECEACRMIALGSALDVIEIDAASNTGVDNIRELIEKSQFAPVQCRYKVYVIDECHMLSQAAFNALLKTLEEPPERVVFILATTDPQRVLSTIISRCQKFDYRRIPLDSMVSHLINIAKAENIDIEKDAITLVGQIANGGLRDAQSLLDQLSLLSGTITVDKVWDLVGAVPEKDLLQLIREIKNNNSEGVINQCRHLMNRGREPLIVLQNLANFYLSLLIAKTAPQRSDLVAVTAPTWEQLCQEGKEWEIFNILQGQKLLKESEFQIKNTTQPRLWLEVTLLSLLPSAQVKTVVVENVTPPVQNNPQPKQNIPNQTVQNPPIASNNYPEKTPIQPVTTPPENQSNINNNQDNLTNNNVENINNIENLSNEEIWQQFLHHLHPPATQALLKQHCHLISISGNTVYLGIKNEALLKMAQGKIINAEAAFEKVLQRKVQVKIQVENSQSEKKNLTSNNNSVYNSNENGHRNGHFPSQINRQEVKNNIVPRKIENQENLPPSEAPKKLEENIKEKPPISPPSVRDNGGQIDNFAEVNQENISEIELEKISARLAEIFKGTVIEIEDYFSINEDEEIEDIREDMIENNQSKNEPKNEPNIPQELENKSSQNQSIPKISMINRPDLSIYENEDDIPF